MATGDGVISHSYVSGRTKHGAVTEIVKRDIYWARYVDVSAFNPISDVVRISSINVFQWSITTPLLLLDLCLLAGLNGASILVTVVSDVIMILTGLFAALSKDEGQGWGWYAFACIAYLNIIYQVGYKGTHALSARDYKTRAFFGSISLFTLLLWTAYPM